METGKEKFGKPMEREREGHRGGGQLFMVRRESALQSGVLNTKGHSDNFLAFRPSNFFMRVLGDDVLRLKRGAVRLPGSRYRAPSANGRRGSGGTLRGVEAADGGHPRPRGRPGRVLQQGIRRPVR